MLSSPMILIMMALMGLMACMQYVDPEAMEEVQAEMSGKKGQEKKPYETMPSLIAKPKQAVAFARSNTSNRATKNSVSHNLLQEDSDSQEEDT